MAEALALAAVILAAASGVPGLFFSRRSPWGERIATSVLAVASSCGAGSAAWALAAPSAVGLRRPWAVPGGVFAVRVDALSAMFLLLISLLSVLGAVYGLRYWRQSDHPTSGRKLRLFYGLLTAGICLLLVARNAVLFLAGWEVMALTAFLTITTEDEQPAVRQVGYVYLVATRIGTLALFGMFALLAQITGYFGFHGQVDANTPGATAVFLLGLGGFGLKAGIMPLHVWLPGAHGNAPSHVSALMSGALIKTGIYGFVRLCSLFPQPPLWWGVLVLALGAASGVLGVAFAIGQHDIKRLLAYHSVENIGIMWLGLGVALLGRSAGRADLVALGLSGCLLHVWNHGLFKALLFYGAGAVLHATGTREIDALGGLLRRMPATGLAFLIGAVAICGLPPLNGLVSELLVYLGLFRSAIARTGPIALPAVVGVLSLALIGGLAVACFVKVFGVVFLGEPRTSAGASAHDPPWPMTGPMFVLAALCTTIGLFPPLVAPVLERAARAWTQGRPGLETPLAELAPLMTVGALSAALLVSLFAGGLWFWRRTRGSPADLRTWDCGYAAPNARMQYTSSSFAQMLVGLFAWALRPVEHRPQIRGYFPSTQRFWSHVRDIVLDGFIIPIGRLVGRSFRWVRFIQIGNVHAYLLYILVALVFLLVRSHP